MMRLGNCMREEKDMGMKRSGEEIYIIYDRTCELLSMI